jgi:hypothetical protein
MQGRGTNTRSNNNNVVSPLSINTNDESVLSSPNTSNETAPSASEAAPSLSEGASAPDSDELSPRTPMPLPQPQPQPAMAMAAVPGSPELQLQAQLQLLEADAILDEQLDNEEAALPDNVSAVVSC